MLLNVYKLELIIILYFISFSSIYRVKVTGT